MSRGRRRRPLLVRLLLAAYPRSFRRQYGDDVARAVVDLRRRGGARRSALVARLVSDVARSAPKMLTSPGWAVWMLSWATGTVLVLFGAVLGFARLAQRPAP